MSKKLTEAELEQLQQIKKDSFDVVAALGELNYQKITLDLFIDEQKQKIKDIKVREKSVLDDLQAKYGNVNINIETGEIN
jgi:hypothetical protein